MMFCKRI
jgi:hypothetical protein